VLARRYRFNDFAGAYNRQEQVGVSLRFAPTGALVAAQRGQLWSSDQAGADRAARDAAWRRTIESTELFALLADARPLAVDVVVEEGDIH
jgi:hypothetical protein